MNHVRFSCHSLCITRNNPSTCICASVAPHYCRNFLFFPRSPPEKKAEKIFASHRVVVSWRCEEKTRAKTIAQKINKRFFSEATFHIHKFSTFSPYSTCLCYAVLLNFFLLPLILILLPAASTTTPQCSPILPPLYTLHSVFLWKIRKNYVKKRMNFFSQAKNKWY